MMKHLILCLGLLLSACVPVPQGIAPLPTETLLPELMETADRVEIHCREGGACLQEPFGVDADTLFKPATMLTVRHEGEAEFSLTVERADGTEEVIIRDTGVFTSPELRLDTTNVVRLIMRGSGPYTVWLHRVSGSSGD